MIKNNFVRKKSEIRIKIDVVTTVIVVERPTPVVPPVVLNPKKQPSTAMSNPKNTVFPIPLNKSEIVIVVKTELI